MLPTVKVCHPDGGWMLINQSDYDGAVHQLWHEPLNQQPTLFLDFLNSVSSTQLADCLAGVGEVSAQSVIAARNQLADQRFTDLSQLPKLRGVNWEELANEYQPN